MTKKSFLIICTFFALIFPLSYAVDIDSCQTLASPDSIYDLTQDIVPPLDEDCIVIAAENITLDCHEHSITSSFSVRGVYSTHPYTTIRNCNVSMGVFGYGIELLSANNSHIFNNTLNNQHRGLFCTDVHNVLIEENAANNNAYVGIKVTTNRGTSGQNILIGNTVKGNHIGIMMVGSISSELIQNTANDNTNTGIWLSGGSNNNVDRNTADNNSEGIILGSSSDNTVRRNNANYNTRYGIYVLSSSLNNNIGENKFCYNSDMDVRCTDEQTFNNNRCDLSGSVCGGSCLLCSEYKDDCVDGTANEDCSNINAPLYCDSGELVFDLNKCGAEIGKCCQSVKIPAPYAVRLSVNVPYSEDCSNAHTYFDITTIGGFWVDSTFTEMPGVAYGIGGFPTSIQCRDDITPEIGLNRGVRYKDNACIFVPWGEGDKQPQIAILDWNYSGNSYCALNGGDIAVIEITYKNITLYPGWNLISLPLIPTDPDIDAVMQGCNYNRIWEFQSDQTWKSTSTDLSTMNIYKGYWVDRVGLSGNCEIRVEGTVPRNTAMDADSQWTLAGYPSLRPKLISDIMPGVPYDRVWEFQSDQTWKSTSSVLAYMQPGKGYWIDSPATGLYYVTN